MNFDCVAHIKETSLFLWWLLDNELNQKWVLNQIFTLGLTQLRVASGKSYLK